VLRFGGGCGVVIDGRRGRGLWVGCCWGMGGGVAVGNMLNIFGFHLVFSR